MLLYATLRYPTLRYSTLLYPTLRYSTLLYATLLYATLRYYSTLCGTIPPTLKLWAYGKEIFQPMRHPMRHHTADIEPMRLVEGNIPTYAAPYVAPYRRH
jgi:hypothetical protein